MYRLVKPFTFVSSEAEVKTENTNSIPLSHVLQPARHLTYQTPSTTPFMYFLVFSTNGCYVFQIILIQLIFYLPVSRLTWMNKYFTRSASINDKLAKPCRPTVSSFMIAKQIRSFNIVSMVSRKSPWVQLNFTSMSPKFLSY